MPLHCCTISWRIKGDAGAINMIIMPGDLQVLWNRLMGPAVPLSHAADPVTSMHTCFRGCIAGSPCLPSGDGHMLC